MGNRDTVVRALHDVGAAAWFGGTLMGAIGLNGAAQHVSDPLERAQVASAGWARWAPVSAAAVGAHLVGGAGLLLSNRTRAQRQAGTRANTVTKLALTGVALGLTAWSGTLGSAVADAGPVPADGGVKPSPATPQDVARSMQRLRVVQWAIPAVVGTIIALGSQQGEQQKPDQSVAGLARRAGRRVTPSTLSRRRATR